MLVDGLVGLNLSSYSGVTFESDEEDVDVVGKGGGDVNNMMPNAPMEVNCEEGESKAAPYCGNALENSQPEVQPRVHLIGGPNSLPRDRASSDELRRWYDLEMKVMESRVGKSGPLLEAYVSCGRYLDALQHCGRKIFSSTASNAGELSTESQYGALSDLRKRMWAYIEGGEENETRIRAAECMWMAVCSLNLFLQANYTGPQLSDGDDAELDKLLITFFGLKNNLPSVRWANGALAVDGELPYPRSQHPVALVFARVILGALSGIAGKWGSSPTTEDELTSQEIVMKQRLAISASLSTVHWWSARAIISHSRLMMITGCGSSSPLFLEAVDCFKVILREFGGCNSFIAARAWLEWGLAQNYFEEFSKGKEAFENAQKAAGLKIKLSGALGKRTKYQKSDVAQLLLLTDTRELNDEREHANNEASLGHSDDILAPLPREDKPKPGSGLGARENPHKFELGKPVICKAEDGSLAAVRQVEHSRDSHLLEEIHFSEDQIASVGKQQDVEVDHLCVILALCLDFANHNPRDGLTNEQMSPYVERVLQQHGSSRAQNWMVYSTALLTRAWIEFERPHAAERAAIQLQALVDQHVTHLTVMQASSAAVETAAPVEDRLMYIHSLAYPPRWELQRDLAMRYMRIGVYGSAAELFVLLEMWDEAVQCYAGMDMPGKAESIARQRLSDPDTATPQMWCALGDLTQNHPEYYEKAWELSKGRYAKAQVSLGRYHFGKGDYRCSVKHLEKAVSIKPLLPAAWFTLGSANMRLERWADALRAFSRVVMQCPEEGQAYANSGAIHLRQGNWEAAVTAFKESLKYQRDDWRIWDNYLTALLNSSREYWGEAIYAMHRLLDFSDKHKRPVDTLALKMVVEAATDGYVPVGQVEELLGRTTSICKTDADVWGVCASFNENLNRGHEKILECRQKQWRAIYNLSGWERDPSSVARLVAVTTKLVRLFQKSENQKTSMIKARYYLKSVISRVQKTEVTVECQDFLNAQNLLNEVEAMLAEL